MPTNVQAWGWAEQAPAPAPAPRGALRALGGVWARDRVLGVSMNDQNMLDQVIPAEWHVASAMKPKGHYSTLGHIFIFIFIFPDATKIRRKRRSSSKPTRKRAFTRRPTRSHSVTIDRSRWRSVEAWAWQWGGSQTQRAGSVARDRPGK